MAVTGVDKWLKGLEDLTTLDPADLENTITSLEAEAEVIQLKIVVLRPLLEKARQRQAQDELAAKAGTNGATPAVEDRPSTWKGDAVLDFLARHPHQMFAPREVRNRLRAEGILQDDEGTTMPVLLKRLADRDQIHTVGGKYSAKPQAPRTAAVPPRPFAVQGSLSVPAQEDE